MIYFDNKMYGLKEKETRQRLKRSIDIDVMDLCEEDEVKLTEENITKLKKALEYMDMCYYATRNYDIDKIEMHRLFKHSCTSYWLYVIITDHGKIYRDQIYFHNRCHCCAKLIL